MKKRVGLFSTLSLVLALTGCSQVFEGNLFKSADTAPTYSSSQLSSLSVNQIHNLTKDPNFYAQLKGSSSDFSTVATTLGDAISSSSSSASDVELALRTYILILAYGTDASTAVNNAISTFLPYLTAGNFSDVTTAANITNVTASLFSGMNVTQVTNAVTAFYIIYNLFGGNLLSTNLYAKSAPTAADTTAFFGSDNKADLAQIGTVAYLCFLEYTLCFSTASKTADFIISNGQNYSTDVDIAGQVTPPASTFNTLSANFATDYTKSTYPLTPPTYTDYLQPLAVDLLNLSS